MHRSINTSRRSQQILRLGSSGALYKEGSVSQPVGALQGSGYCLETLLHREGDSLLKGFSSLADVITMNLGQVSLIT